MFSAGDVGIRMLEEYDLSFLCEWQDDVEIEYLSGWGPRLPKEAFMKRWEQRLREPQDDILFFGIFVKGTLVGRIELAHIDRTNRNAAAGLFIGRRDHWNRGTGTAALRLLLDYAFTVENLERVWAHVYSFNDRAKRLMERVGFAHEGVLRQHEMHHGALRDMHAYGILKAEFYRKHATIFPTPKEQRGMAEV